MLKNSIIVLIFSLLGFVGHSLAETTQPTFPSGIYYAYGSPGDSCYHFNFSSYDIVKNQGQVVFTQCIAGTNNCPNSNISCSYQMSTDNGSSFIGKCDEQKLKISGYMNGQFMLFIDLLSVNLTKVKNAKCK